MKTRVLALVAAAVAVTGVVSVGQATALGNSSGCLRLPGKGKDAADAYSRALELYERKGNLVSAEQARRELADLAAS